MKKLTIAMLTGVMSASGWSACTYNFDATQAQISAVLPSLNPIKMVNLSNSKTQILISSSQNTQYYLALSSDIANKKIALMNSNSYLLPKGDINISTPGILAYEYEIKIPSNLLYGEQITIGPLLAVGTSGSSNSSGIIASQYDSNNLGVVGYNNFQTSNNQNYATNVSGTNRVGIYFNQSTKNWGVIINGVNKGYVGHLDYAVDNYGFQFSVGTSGFSQSSPSIGKSVTLELVTDKNQFQFTYPTGTKDICGNTI
ncbi:DUF4882 domain-containing protein [Acinetobacter bereziniae]|uniref:DUF4882 domain-containing protein n=1 Tax=Acinetobacter bereziniae TaxID=106648 RepID=UPI0021CEFDCF|nr:DUF4882 domain-containing protein [Acinetobacter bereziniae]MCU4416152.1 DUF4882 domain-containing protein [Acinetobacter bereziniae]